MKKWLFISVFLFLFLGLGAIGYIHGLRGYLGGSSTASAASGAFAPCPYTSNIPDYIPPQTYPSAVNVPTYTYNVAASAVVATPAHSAPSNASYPSSFIPTDYSKLVVFCEKRGFRPNPEMTACVPVVIPAHAHLSVWGTSYDCDQGYNTRGNSCVGDSYVNAVSN